MIGLSKTLVIAVALSCANGQAAYFNTQEELHPVHGLYVKPSIDGTTGDLYVAATEDDGKSTQWLADQSINFLPAAAHQVNYASSLAGMSQPRDEAIVSTKKRAVITSPTMKYTYPHAASPINEVKTVPYYPAPMPASTKNPVPLKSETSANPCALEGLAAQMAAYPQYSPFQYFYPHLLSMAFANAINAMRNPGSEDVTSSSAMGQPAPMWSPYPYPGYPVQYVMIDPTAWFRSQTAAATVPLPTPATTNEETEENEDA